MSMVIAKAYPKLNIVVEDLPEVVRDAEKVCQPACLIIKGFLTRSSQFWKANLAESFDSGRVRLVREPPCSTFASDDYGLLPITR